MRVQNNFLVFKNNEKKTALFNGLAEFPVYFLYFTKLIWRTWWKILSQID